MKQLLFESIGHSEGLHSCLSLSVIVKVYRKRSIAFEMYNCIQHYPVFHFIPSWRGRPEIVTRMNVYWRCTPFYTIFFLTSISASDSGACRKKVSQSNLQQLGSRVKPFCAFVIVPYSAMSKLSCNVSSWSPKIKIASSSGYEKSKKKRFRLPFPFFI